MEANEINAYCTICNTGYHVCKSCLEMKSFKPWRTVTDTFEHYRIFLAVHGYTISKDKDTAKSELQNCDLSDLESFRPEIQKIIKEILTEEISETPEIIEKNKEEIKSEDVPVEQTEILVEETVKPQRKSTKKLKNVDKTDEVSNESIE
jgi:hypothetical protein